MLGNKIVFGTMRISEFSFDNNYWVNLFSFLFDNGVKTHHISCEYSSYEKYCLIYKRFQELYPDKKINHIVKLPEPNFNINHFSEEKFLNILNKYRTDLEINYIYAVQWMWRGSLQDDKKRCRSFTKDILKIYLFTNYLKSERLIKFFLIFPYSTRFANFCSYFQIKFPNFIDGLTIYRNFNETEFDYLISKGFKLNYAIRPLMAGKLNGNIHPKTAIQFSLNHKNITGCIVSISSKEKFIELSK